MLRRYANSLVTRLIVCGVCLVLAGTIGRALLLNTLLQSDFQAVAAAQQASLARYLAHDVDVRVTERLDLLRRLGANLPPELLDRPEQLRAWLAERQTLFPLFSNGLVVVPASGEGVIADFPELPGRRQLNFTDRDWFLGARDQRQAMIGKPYRGRLNEEPLIVMAVPLGAEGAPPRAVLAGVTALAAPGFLDVVEKTRIGESGGALLISPRDKLFVSSSDPRMILTNTPPPGVNLLHDRAMAGFRGTGITVNAFGVEELSAIAGVPSADWFVVVRLPTDEAFRAMKRLQDFTKRYSALIAVLVIGAVIVVVPRMLKPLRDSARAIRRMADGETELRPLPVVREDEVGALVTGFNYLVEQVQKRETELREREAQMARKAHHDPLTGLPNRAMFHQCLQQEIAFTDVAGNAFALMFLDLDGFKPVNDSYGHAAGDEVLRQVAARLKDAARPLDIVARLGGDEFVIIAITDLNAPRTTAETVATKCLEAIGLPFAVAGAEIRIGLSIGIAICPEDGQDAGRLMSHADAALYLAKSAGRGRFVFYGDAPV